MGDYFYTKDLGRMSASATGTNAGCSATITGVTKERLSPTGIQASGDAAALVTIESPSGTVLWRKRFTAAFAFSEDFLVGAILGASGQNLLVKISASTSNCEANIQALAISG